MIFPYYCFLANICNEVGYTLAGLSKSSKSDLESTGELVAGGISALYNILKHIRDIFSHFYLLGTQLESLKSEMRKAESEYNRGRRSLKGIKKHIKP